MTSPPTFCFADLHSPERKKKKLEKINRQAVTVDTLPQEQTSTKILIPGTWPSPTVRYSCQQNWYSLQPSRHFWRGIIPYHCFSYVVGHIGAVYTPELERGSEFSLDTVVFSSIHTISHSNGNDNGTAK